MKGVGKGVKNLSKSMRVHKKENESAAEWEVQSGDISVYPNPSYKNYKVENAKYVAVNVSDYKFFKTNYSVPNLILL